MKKTFLEVPVGDSTKALAVDSIVNVEPHDGGTLIDMIASPFGNTATRVVVDMAYDTLCAKLIHECGVVLVKAK